jgi:hypothetical protein
MDREQVPMRADLERGGVGRSGADELRHDELRHAMSADRPLLGPRLASTFVMLAEVLGGEATRENRYVV